MIDRKQLIPVSVSAEAVELVGEPTFDLYKIGQRFLLHGLTDRPVEVMILSVSRYGDHSPVHYRASPLSGTIEWRKPEEGTDCFAEPLAGRSLVGNQLTVYRIISVGVKLVGDYTDTPLPIGQRVRVYGVADEPVEMEIRTVDDPWGSYSSLGACTSYTAAPLRRDILLGRKASFCYADVL